MSSPLHCCPPQRYRTPPQSPSCMRSKTLKSRILYLALSLSNILHSNVQIVVGEDEPEDRIINPFKKEVLKVGVFQECKRRRKPQSRAWAQNKHDFEKKKKDAADDDIDDWELPHVGIPYT
ncbi:30S ribosomal protein S21, chloroplastic [Glycine max]|nr:30S ribosomal protein S21, chloroplastic [Glycine max]